MANHAGFGISVNCRHPVTLNVSRLNLERIDMNDSSNRTAMIGTRKFQWSFGGWFGSSIGGTCWLAGSAVALAWRGDHHLATISALSWFTMLAASIWLWSQRDRVAPFRAYAIFLALFSLVMPIVWFTCWDSPTDDIIPSLYWVRWTSATAACTMAPFALLGFTIGEYITHPTTPKENRPLQNVG